MIELVDELELFQLINEDGMIELAYLYFANPNEMIGLDNDHQLLPATQEEKQQVVMCLLMEEPSITCKIELQK